MAVTWTRVAGINDIDDEGMVPLEIAGRRLALYRVGGAWYCTDNVCTHAFALLTEGWLEEFTVECPIHQGQFDIRTGKALCAPVSEDLATYEVQVEGTDVLVALP